ncbi:MAG: DUF3987 domain-containing protein [Planctomycetota bacterium]|nr:DUF3987 domain-containing protein [Planctomycetota bacterium]
MTKDQNDLKAESRLPREGAVNCEQWHEEGPIPLPSIENGANFPVDAMGPTLAGAARAICSLTTAPLAMCASSVLANGNASVQGLRDVSVFNKRSDNHDHGIPLSSNLIIVGNSGEGKGRCDDFANKPIKDFVNESKRRSEVKIRHYKDEVDMWESEKKRIKSSKSPKKEKLRRLEILGPEPKRPPTGALLFDDATAEGIIRSFREDGAELFLNAEEGATVFSGVGFSAENKDKFVSYMCKFWSAKEVNTKRKGEGSMTLRGRRLSVLINIQYDLAIKLLNDEVLKSRGAWGRMLPCAAPTRMGTCFEERERVISMEEAKSLERYSAALTRALKTERSYINDNPFELAPQLIRFEEKGAELLRNFNNELEAMIAPGGEFYEIRELARRGREHAARFAAGTALVEDPEIKELTEEDALRGTIITRFYLDEALRLRGLSNSMIKYENVHALYDWVVESGSSHITYSEIRQYGPRRLRDKETAEGAIEILIDHRLFVEEQNVIHKGKRRRKAFRVVKTKPGIASAAA